jgi:hypothetical protein
LLRIFKITAYDNQTTAISRIYPFPFFLFPVKASFSNQSFLLFQKQGCCKPCVSSPKSLLLMRFKSLAGHVIWPAKNVLPLLFLLGCQLLAVAVHAQAQRIEGTVTDPKGTPLPGVNILIKSGSSGTISDKNGKYILMADPAAVLVFSYTGFLNQEEKVGDRTVINVSMLETNAMLDNVVVVGYGTQKKVNLRFRSAGHR